MPRRADAVRRLSDRLREGSSCDRHKSLSGDASGHAAWLFKEDNPLESLPARSDFSETTPEPPKTQFLKRGGLAKVTQGPCLSYRSPQPVLAAPGLDLI